MEDGGDREEVRIGWAWRAINRRKSEATIP
jgi:hypothetical protein